MNYFIYAYIAVGVLWSFLTVKDTINWLWKKYPQMSYTGVTKFQKFKYWYFKTMALGMAVTIHFGLTIILYPVSMGEQLVKQLKKERVK